MRSFSIVFFFTLLGLENFTNNVSIKMIPLFLLFALFAVNLFYMTSKGNFKIPPYIYILLALTIIGMIRNNHPTTSVMHEFYRLSCFLLIIITFIQTVNNEFLNSTASFLKLFVWTIYVPLLALIVTNLLGHILGLKAVNANEVRLGDAVLLSKFGLSVERVSFPFSIGFNSYSVIVGVLLLVSIFGFRYFRQYRFVMLGGILSSILSLLLIDTRSALLYPVLIFVLSFLIEKRRQFPKVLWLLPLVTIFGSTLLLATLTIAAQIPELAFMSRSSDDFETGNSRSFIWLMASLEFINFKMIHIIGYGEYGHYKSGASAQWSDIFGQWGESSDLISPHSSFYSILFDYGYIGLAFITLFQYKLLSLIKNNWHHDKSLCIVFLSFIIYWNLIGITEAVSGFYTPNFLVLLIIFSLFIYVLEFLSFRREKPELPKVYIVPNVDLVTA